MNTNKAIINSWNWQHQLGYAQAVEISHSTHTLYGGGQAAMNAEGRPVTADMGGQISLSFRSRLPIITSYVAFDGSYKLTLI